MSEAQNPSRGVNIKRCTGDRMSETDLTTDDRESRRLFQLAFAAIVATSFGFVLRAFVIDDWGREFALSETQKAKSWERGSGRCDQHRLAELRHRSRGLPRGVPVCADVPRAGHGVDS